jgi:hypothetical protein
VIYISCSTFALFYVYRIEWMRLKCTPIRNPVLAPHERQCFYRKCGKTSVTSIILHMVLNNCWYQIACLVVYLSSSSQIFIIYLELANKVGYFINCIKTILKIVLYSVHSSRVRIYLQVLFHKIIYKTTILLIKYKICVNAILI